MNRIVANIEAANSIRLNREAVALPEIREKLNKRSELKKDNTIVKRYTIENSVHAFASGSCGEILPIALLGLVSTMPRVDMMPENRNGLSSALYGRGCPSSSVS